MRNLIYIALLLFQINFGQQALQNSGNIQIHDQGQIGFHIDLINNGTFNENLGLAGFYNSDNSLKISGTKTPRFFDMDIAVDDNLFLEINTEVSNGLYYIIGDIITPRTNSEISLDYLSNSFFVSEDDFRLTDGYAAITGNNSFTFPIGDDNKLRPLIIPTQNISSKFKAAYFNEDPNFPSTFLQSFNTNNSEVIISKISNEEFWDFNGTNKTLVTLTWDQESQIPLLTNDLLNLRVVGWSKAENKWLDLGNTNVTGDLNNGTISSFQFTPNDFEIITFGSLIGSDGLVVYNGISPNNDGVNETFIIEGIDLFKNELKIFNRWGRVVYDAVDYKNTFNGVSNKKNIGSQGDRLPVGTYFYILQLTEDNKTYSGWIYINY
ncbi:gliding motility-associated-like protein [Lacinutrix venerupis]|uniref:gliding motility-associated C-terminal domain-containing protein n=1 Tax=Lacinutrix venerupis TaxID=1486034 RepID=UPI000EB0E941|nr:gliding motility-associated C-terminal domain-containing protein [Lacinutrix venerupis]RLJ67293.1 gliding motility-associated-like protein [Lacinutrix venerupis]